MPSSAYSRSTIPYDQASNWQLLVYDENNNLVDIPQSDIESIQTQKVLNGGSGEATLTFRRPFNDVGAIGYTYSFRLWVWPANTTKPTNPYWTGIQEDPDQIQLSASGQSVVHAYGDFTMLNDAIVSLQFNPNVDGNPSLDCATLLTTLLGPNQPPGWLSPVIPSTMFPLLASTYTHEGLADVLDDLLSQGRDSTGLLFTWRVNVNAAGQRQIVIQKDQNPNVISGVQFRHLFANSDFDTYKIAMKYRDIINVVAVYGAKDPTTGAQAYGVFEDGTSQSDFHRIKEAAITVESLQTNEACEAYGEVWLDLNAYPSAQGSCRLLVPDPTIDVGTWVQFWEAPADAVNPPSIKQVRITQIDLTISKPNRIEQVLTTTSPVPYLDKAIYRIGNEIKTKQSISNSPIGVNRQRLYIRSGAILSSSSDTPAKVALTACQAVFPDNSGDGHIVRLAALPLTLLKDDSGGPNNGVTGDGNYTVSVTSSGTWVITLGDVPANSKTQQNVLCAYVVGGVPFCVDVRILRGYPGFSDELPSIALASGHTVLVGIPANTGAGAVDVPIDFYLDPTEWTNANHHLSYFEIGAVPHGSSQPIATYTKVVPTIDAHISCSVPGLGAGATYDFYVTAFDNLDRPTQALFLCTDTASPVSIGVGNVNVAANLPAPNVTNNGALTNVGSTHPTQADIETIVDLSNVPTDGSAEGLAFYWREHGATPWNPSGEIDLQGLPGETDAQLSSSSIVGATTFNVVSSSALLPGQKITFSDVNDPLTINTVGTGTFSTTTGAAHAHANTSGVISVAPAAVQQLGYVYGSMANGKKFDFAVGYSSLGGYGVLTQIGTTSQKTNGFTAKALVVTGPYLDNGSLVTPTLSGTTVAHVNQSGGMHAGDTTVVVDTDAELSVGQEITFSNIDDPLVIQSINHGTLTVTFETAATQNHPNTTGILAALAYNGISANGVSAEVTLQFDITNQPTDQTLSLVRIWYRRHGGTKNWADGGGQTAVGLGQLSPPSSGSYVFGLADLANGDVYDFAVTMESTAGRESNYTTLVSSFTALTLNIPTSGLPTIPVGTTVTATGSITGYSAVDGGAYHAAFTVHPTITPPSSDPRPFNEWGAGFMILGKVNDTGSTDGDLTPDDYFKAGEIQDNSWTSGSLTGYTNGLSAGHAYQLAIAPYDQAGNMGPLAIFALTVAQYIGGGSIRDGPNKIKNATFDKHAPFDNQGKCEEAASWLTYGTVGNTDRIYFGEGGGGKACAFQILSNAYGSGVGAKNHNVQCLSDVLWLEANTTYCFSGYIDASNATAGTLTGTGPPSIALITESGAAWDMLANDPAGGSYAPQSGKILTEIAQNYAESGNIEDTYTTGTSDEKVRLLFQSHGAQFHDIGVFAVPMLQEGDHRGPFNFGDKSQGPRGDTDPLNTDYPVDTQGGITAGTGGGWESHLGMSWETQSLVERFTGNLRTAPVFGSAVKTLQASGLMTGFALQSAGGTASTAEYPFPAYGGWTLYGNIQRDDTTTNEPVEIIIGDPAGDGYGLRWDFSGDVNLVTYDGGVATVDPAFQTASYNLPVDTDIHSFRLAVSMFTDGHVYIEASFDIGGFLQPPVKDPTPPTNFFNTIGGISTHGFRICAATPDDQVSDIIFKPRELYGASSIPYQTAIDFNGNVTEFALDANFPGVNGSPFGYRYAILQADGSLTGFASAALTPTAFAFPVTARAKIAPSGNIELGATGANFLVIAGDMTNGYGLRWGTAGVVTLLAWKGGTPLTIATLGTITMDTAVHWAALSVIFGSTPGTGDTVGAAFDGLLYPATTEPGGSIVTWGSTAFVNVQMGSGNAGKLFNFRVKGLEP